MLKTLFALKPFPLWDDSTITLLTNLQLIDLNIF